MYLLKGLIVQEIEKNAIYLIDGSYLLYRSYYGLRPLRTSKGIPTQATYGFCRALQKLIDKFDIKNVALVWDSKGKTFRSEIYADYKANRQKPPSDLFEQKEQIIEVAGAINLLQVAKIGYEADDLIGSIVHEYKNKDIVIVGPDKDLYQLLSDHVVIYDPFKDEIVDEESFTSKKGYPANKVKFYHSLLGDASDNIPGVKGIGKKGAQDLVNQFDSLDDLYKSLDKVKKDRTRSLLEQGRENAYLSDRLFSLENIKLDLNLKDFAFKESDWANAAPYFKEFEFTSLLKKIIDQFGDQITEKPEETKKVRPKNTGPQKQLSLFEPEKSIEDTGPMVLVQEKDWQYNIIRDQKELAKLADKLKKQKEFALDTETTGLKPLQDELVGLSVAYDKKKAYYVYLQDMGREVALQILKPVFQDKKIKKILQNTKFDQLALAHYGYELENVEFDTLIAANLLKQDDWEKINLKALSKNYLDQTMKTFKEVLGEYKDFSQVPLSIAGKYAAHDALQTYKLKSVLLKDLNEDKKLKKIFEDLEMPLSQVLFRMELFGIKLDIERLKEVGQDIDRDLKAIKRKILEAIETKKRYETEEINLNSPQQVEILLFEELKLPAIKKSGKGQRSTDQEVLLELAKVHPVPGMIAKYRELAKLASTYIEPLIKQVDPKTGRIHTSYSQTLVATGRLSSSNPNLQNIPAGSDHGIKVRSAFVAPQGKVFLSADYSQIELRVLAHMTKDKALVDAFLHDRDIHKQTASQLFDVPLDKVTHEQRQIGKKINFSIIYGLTPYGLAKDLGIKPGEAKEYIDKYFQQYTGVAKWIEKTVEYAQENGYVQTLMGRRRYVPDINEQNKTLFQAAKRIATNSPIQGTSAEIIKLAMIEIDKIIAENRLEAVIVLQIHDELVLELPKDELDKVGKMVEKVMNNVVEWAIPLKTTIRTGKNWEQITK